MNRGMVKILRALFGLLPVCAPAAAAQMYQVDDLGVAGSSSQAWSVNASGQVAGYARFLPDGHDEGFVHDGTSFRLIGTPPGTSRSDLLGINGAGDAVGKSGTVYEDGCALLRRANGTLEELGTLGGTRSAAWSINDLGSVVGWSRLEGDLESRAFLWHDGVMDSLPVLGGTQAEAHWINGANRIVGSSTDGVSGLQQFGVIWENGAVKRLPPVVAGLSHLAWYIHDDGSIAGAVRIADSTGTRTRAAIWRDGKLDEVLGTLADGTPGEPFASSVAHAVNATGVVVGMSVNASGGNVPFVAFGGTLHAMQDLMPPPWVPTYLGMGSLNDAGQIAVSAFDPADPAAVHVLLLTPSATAAPEPARPGPAWLAVRGRRIVYSIPRGGRVTISLYDVGGRVVSRVLDAPRAAGMHELIWDGRTRAMRNAAAGVYFVRMSAPGGEAAGRVTLVR